MSELTLAERIERVRMAIGLIKQRDQQWREWCQDASVPPSIVDHGKELILFAENEFGWQWRNVEAILDELKAGRG